MNWLPGQDLAYNNFLYS